MIGEAFRYLTDEDIHLLESNYRELSYKAGEHIVTEGERLHGLFLLRDGSARVEKESHGEGVAIAVLTKGDIFGEMSFVDDSKASATIIADEPVDLFFIEGIYVHSLLESAPGLSSRFYHSIAALLADRLRATSGVASHSYSWG